MVTMRECTADDLETVVDMLADDEIGTRREDASRPIAQGYRDAFAAMCAQEGNTMYVAVEGGDVLGCFQFTVIPGLSRMGKSRAQVESVRVARGARGRGIGETMLRFAIEQAKAQGCGLVQLTTDRAREDAFRFYERLGFTASHWGMKLSLD